MDSEAPAKRQKLEMPSFAVLPVKGRFDRPQIKVKRSKEIAFMSRGKDLEWRSTTSALRVHERHDYTF